MRANFLHIVFLFLFISCNSGKPDVKNYEVYVWKATYNPTELPTDDYTTKSESDTLIDGSPIHLDSTQVRSLLYRNFETVDTTKWDRQTFKIGNDTLVRYTSMLESVWYDPKDGILRIMFPHSTGPGKVRSYELIKQIQFDNGNKNEKDFTSIISAINAKIEKDREEFMKRMEKEN